MKYSLQSKEKGLTLVELMVAMAIGMVVMLGATGVLIANQRTFQATEDIAGMQENARTAIEMISRDIREAGGHPCGTVAVVNKAGADGDELNAFWTNPLTLNTADNPGNRSAGSGAIRITRAVSTNDITTYSQNSPSITLDGNADSLQANDVIMVCNPEKGFIFKVSGVALPNITLQPTPTESLQNGVVVSRSETNLWYIGNNGRAEGVGTSLYRFTDGDAAPAEMVDNVVNMVVNNAAPGTVQITLTLCARRPLPEGERNDAVLGNNNPLCRDRAQRTVTTIVQPRI